MRQIRWIASSGGLLAALYLGLVEGVQGALYIALFYVWLICIASLAVLSKEGAAKLRAEGRAVPAPLGWSVSLACVGLLVWHGYLVTGGAFLLAVLLVGGARDGEIGK